MPVRKGPIVPGGIGEFVQAGKEPVVPVETSLEADELPRPIVFGASSPNRPKCALACTNGRILRR